VPVLSLDDVDLNYSVTGSGPAMLFLAATAWHGRPWELHQVPEFSRDHAVIVYDQRGTGRSTTRSKDFSTKRLADDAAALLEHLGVTGAIVCGHSNGGRVAQQLTVDHPHLVGKLILASAGGTHGSNGISIATIVDLVEKGYPRYVREFAIETGCTKAYYDAHRDRVEAFLDVRMADLPPLDVFLGHILGRQASDVSARIGEIRVPTLVLAGDDEDHGSDITHLDFAKLHARGIPGAKLVIFPGEGHYYPFLSPEPTHRVIREFLEAH
jgi:pimeloyl-ACP methyl ester carboxylesterase